jgi:hypothetical protein
MFTRRRCCCGAPDDTVIPCSPCNLDTDTVFTMSWVSDCPARNGSTTVAYDPDAGWWEATVPLFSPLCNGTLNPTTYRLFCFAGSFRLASTNDGTGGTCGWTLADYTCDPPHYHFTVPVAVGCTNAGITMDDIYFDV